MVELTRAPLAADATRPLDRAIAGVMLMAAFVYLLPFVPRGWIPHDEGMLGQAAERVLRGELPHVDFQEPYTGGLSGLYAVVFHVSGTDLVNVRWVLLAVAVASMALVYSLLRRHLNPPAAALGVWVALAWSFPNYFAGLPSWWMLLLALFCLWARIRHLETNETKYLVAAGLGAACAVLIKQTGAYIGAALLMSLLAGGAHVPVTGATAARWRAVRLTAAVGAVAGVALLMRTRAGGGELVYLALPIAAVTMVVAWRGSSLAGPLPDVRSIAIFLAVAAAPVLVLFGMYGAAGRLGELIEGAFLLPQRRLQFASAAMPPSFVIVTGILMGALMVGSPASLSMRERRILASFRWVLAAALPLLALTNVAVYQVIWQSARAAASLLPMLACWLIVKHGPPAPHRSTVLASAAMLAWASLVQYPYGAPIYFCYVAPLAVIAAVQLRDAWPGAASRWKYLCWAVLLIAFAVLSMHRGYARTLGGYHAVAVFDTRLPSARAGLLVSRHDGNVYGRILELIADHRKGGALVAGPDTPEIYYLAGEVSPDGALFDFFSERRDESAWSGARIVVVNHRPEFSPPVTDSLLSRVRRDFPNSEHAGHFEVRWR